MTIFDPAIFDPDPFVEDGGALLGATTQAPQRALGAVAYGATVQGAQRGVGRIPFTSDHASITLFRGQVISANVVTVGDLPQITIKLSDYNRLPPIIPVGAPTGFIGLTQPDGTILQIDPRALNYGIAAIILPGYWPLGGDLALDVDSGFLAADPPGVPVIDRTTARTNLEAFLRELAQHVEGPSPDAAALVRSWIDPDLVFWWLDLLNSDPIPAPYEIDADVGWAGSREDWPGGPIRPLEGADIGWDFSALRSSAYVNGATPAPEGSGFAFGSFGGGPWGTQYIEAPGVQTASERDRVGRWHSSRDFVDRLTGKIPIAAGYDGWRVGQTLTLTSALHGRLLGHPIDHRTAIIQKVSGRLISGGGGDGEGVLRLFRNGIELTRRIDWDSFSFAQSMDSAEQATLVFTLTDDDDLEITRLDDIRIQSDGAPIEYLLDVGDAPAGALTVELGREEQKTPDGPAYRFDDPFVEDPDMPVGASCAVSTQATDASGAGFPVNDLPMIWYIVQWADAEETEPGTGYSLEGTPGSDGGYDGITDATGRAFQTLHHDDDTTDHYYLRAVALPVS